MDASGRLISARRGARLTQRELARRAGVPQSTVARIEAGTTSPRLDTYDRLLEACGKGLETVDRAGVGVDRSQIRELLVLSPSQRLDRAEADAAGLAELGW